MSETNFSLYMYTLDMKEQIPQNVCGRKMKIRNCEQIKWVDDSL